MNIRVICHSEPLLAEIKDEGDGLAFAENKVKLGRQEAPVTSSTLRHLRRGRAFQTCAGTSTIGRILLEV